jgi:hypothetical protein
LLTSVSMLAALETVLAFAVIGATMLRLFMPEAR